MPGARTYDIRINGMKIKHILFIGAVSLLAVLAACRTVPMTGRSQFVVASVEQEKEQGLTAFNQYKRQYKRSTNARYNAAMNSCAPAIVKATGNSEYDWEYTVFESSTQNAFCLPGGKIAVYSGLMGLMKNEAELAFVVSHEIAHALARHGSEQSSWKKLQSLGAALISANSGNSSAASAFEKGTQLGVILPYSRTHEYEADQMGLMLMAQAGYNPSAAIEFWSRFTAGADESALNGWMSTHPRDVDRIAAMRKHLPAAQAVYAKSVNKKGYGMAL